MLAGIHLFITLLGLELRKKQEKKHQEQEQQQEQEEERKEEQERKGGKEASSLPSSLSSSSSLPLYIQIALLITPHLVSLVNNNNNITRSIEHLHLFVDYLQILVQFLLLGE